MPTKHLIRSLLHALGVLAYTAFVAAILENGHTLFGGESSLWGGMAFLMLFVLSAAVVGLLIFARPVILFIDGERKQSIIFLSTTVAWLAILISLILIAGLIV